MWQVCLQNVHSAKPAHTPHTHTHTHAHTHEHAPLCVCVCVFFYTRPLRWVS